MSSETETQILEFTVPTMSCENQIWNRLFHFFNFQSYE